MIFKCEFCNNLNGSKSMAKYKVNGLWCCGVHLAKCVDEVLKNNEVAVVE